MAVRARPLPVIPRAGDEIVQMPVVALLHQLEDFLWAVKIFLIPPARNVERGYGCLLQEREEGLFPPIFIAVRVPDEIVPGGKPTVKVKPVDVRQGAQIQVPVVSVVAIECKVCIGFLRGFEQRGVFEPVAKAEGAVVVKIVPEKHVGGRGAFNGSLERGVRIHQRHHHRPSQVRNAEHPYAAVVVRQVFHQPINRVVGVRAFVYRLPIAAVARRALHDELAFGLEASAQILEHHNVVGAGRAAFIRHAIRPARE